MKTELLNVIAVSKILGISTRKIWLMLAEKKLPEPLRLGARTVRWRLCDIEKFLEDLAQKAGKIEQNNLLISEEFQ